MPLPIPFTLSRSQSQTSSRSAAPSPKPGPQRQSSSTSLSSKSRSKSRSNSQLSSSLPISRPAHHHPSGSGFQNPWPSATHPTLSTFFSSFPIQFARRRESFEGIKVVKPDWSLYDYEGKSDEEEHNIAGTWFGHSTFLVQLPCPPSSKRPVRILFDPMFSDRASPIRYVGPLRFLPTPCKLEDLPEIDYICISHNHYDHMDLPTLLTLYEIQPQIRFFVPLGNKSWLIASSIPARQISELDWWEQADLGPLVSKNHPQGDGDEQTGAPRVRVSCVPAQHGSGRGVTDQGVTLWCGWVVEQFLGGPKESGTDERRATVYFAGDTGYTSSNGSNPVCPIFKDIGDKFYPIDLAMIPIWRGGSLSFISGAGLELTTEHLTKSHHASPSDGVRMHMDLKARNSVAMHFATFVGSEQETVQALEALREAMRSLGVGMLRADESVVENGSGEEEGREDKGRFGWVDVGGSVVIRMPSKRGLESVDI